MRFSQWIKSWIGSRPEWLNIVLLFVTLETAVYSIEQAKWITPQPALTLILALAVAATWLLIRSRLHGAIVLAIVIAAGGLVTALQAYVLLPPSLGDSIAQRIVNALMWWRPGAAVLSSAGNLYFGVFLGLITWGAGCFSTWQVVRRRNAWWVVALGAVMVLVNLSNLPDRYFFFFALYLTAAAALVVYNRRGVRIFKNGRGGRGWLFLGAAMLCLVVLASSLAWALPELRAPSFQTALATHMLWKDNLEASRFNLFNTVPSKQPINTSGTHRELVFEDEWHHGDGIDFTVRADRPSYWRVRVYDTYTSSGWTNSPSLDYLLEDKAPWGKAFDPADPSVITYTVSPNLKTDIMLMAGTFITSGSPTLVKVGAGDVVSVRTPRIFSPGETYSVTTRYAPPSNAELARADAVYPPAIKEYYLQLPGDFPTSVRQLTRQVTRRAATPFDKVMAVDRYLANLQYQENVAAPAENTDGVEHFLLHQKSGFCLYFASAMAVMLRSVDVPTRLAIGYLPGEPGEEPGEYVLKDKHYHAWPQAYFNGYGWVDLEATPRGTESQVVVEAPIVSSDIVAQLPQQFNWEEYLSFVPPFFPFEEIQPRETSAPKKFRFGPLPFADELGRALAILFGAALVLALLATPVLALRSSFGRWLWHVNRADLATATYQKMCRLAAMADIGPRPQQTPAEFTAELSALFPEQAQAFQHITRTYVESTFGRRRGKLGLFEEAEVLKARCIAFGSLLAMVSPITRLTRKRA